MLQKESHNAFDSSVGRAVDCSWFNESQKSIGRWFKSGSKESYFLQLSRMIYSFYFINFFSFAVSCGEVFRMYFIFMCENLVICEISFSNFEKIIIIMMNL